MDEHRQVRCSEPHGFVGAHRDEFSKGSFVTGSNYQQVRHITESGRKFRALARSPLIMASSEHLGFRRLTLVVDRVTALIRFLRQDRTFYYLKAIHVEACHGIRNLRVCHPLKCFGAKSALHSVSCSSRCGRIVRKAAYDLVLEPYRG
jgi:hypothetical protein